jgi:activating signal cointegrator 1
MLVENRTWGTSYRGWIAIHAGKGTQYLTAAALRERVTGAVVAVAQLLAVVDLAAIKQGAACRELYQFSIDGRKLTEAAVLNHRYTEGPQAWVLGGVRRFVEPVPCSGARGLWRWQVPDLLEFDS